MNEPFTLDADSLPLGTRAPRAAEVGPDEPNGWWCGPSDDPDRFELLGNGLAGGEGVTYKARYHGTSGTPLLVAVKQLHPPHDAGLTWPTAHDWSRWRDQLHILQQVSSSHLVQVRDVIAGPLPHPPGTMQVSQELAHSTPFVVMEWVDGQPLAQAAAGVPSRHDLSRRTLWITQLAEAVSALHSATRTGGNPLVHRDIKPSNCIVDSAGERLVLIDIGTTRRTDDVDPRGMHSLHYTAPEVLGDLAAPRRSGSDIYALGCVAYFCLTGQDPPVVTPTSRPVDGRAAEDALGHLPRRLRHRVANHLAAILDASPAERETLHPVAWAHELRTMLNPRRIPRRALVAAVALLAIAVSGYALESRPLGGAETTVQSLANMTPFGTSFGPFGYQMRGATLRIEPPKDYDALRGAYLPIQACASTVEFDTQFEPDDWGTNHGYGLAVAPRGDLVEDQPNGPSIQYEWEPPTMRPPGGSFVRPAQLPGGAWSIQVQPTPAPDASRPHHLKISAVGSAMTVAVDGLQLARYNVPVECGGVVIRAWGAPVTLSRIKISAT